MPRRTSWTLLHTVAKEAAEKAAKNATTAPQLLFAPILFTLQAHFTKKGYPKRLAGSPRSDPRD